MGTIWRQYGYIVSKTGMLKMYIKSPMQDTLVFNSYFV